MKKNDAFSEGYQDPPLGGPTLEPGPKFFLCMRIKMDIIFGQNIGAHLAIFDIEVGVVFAVFDPLCPDALQQGP